jgi:hypothetical protein
MQISPTNFLLAAQQNAKAAPQAKASAAFEPLDFKQTAAPVKETPAYDPKARLGSQIDIRV